MPIDNNETDSLMKQVASGGSRRAAKDSRDNRSVHCDLFIVVRGLSDWLYGTPSAPRKGWLW